MKQTKGLTEDLLDALRIGRGQLELRTLRVALSTPVNMAVEAVRPLIDKTGQQLTVKQPEEPLMLEAAPNAPSRISQMAHAHPRVAKKSLTMWRECAELTHAVILSKGTIMPYTEIITVEGGSELRDFIALPWKIYAGYPRWVPPLKKEVRRMLDPRKHPFWEFSERILFLARRGSETVGRIAGIIDSRSNQIHSEKMGIWGFFECADDPEAAAALFSSVETWVRQKGMNFMRGPLSPSMHHETGLLIEGFDYQPVLMMPYTPPYYPRLVESCGFTKEKDLVAFLIDGDYRLPEWMDRLANRIAKKRGIHIRPFHLKEEDSEFILIKEIYNDSWSGNWGFVPLSDNEMRDIQKSVMPFADPDLVFFIYYDSEPVAVCVILPDINPMLKRLNGRIGLMGLLKFLRYRREIKGYRLVLFGIKEKYRQLGLPMLAFHHIYEVARKEKKFQYLELGWTLEDNEAINLLAEEAGAKPYKKYRLFRKSL